MILHDTSKLLLATLLFVCLSGQSQAQFDPNVYYTLTAKHSGKLLDVSHAGKDNGTNVWQYEANGNDAQKWKIESLGNGYYKLTAKHSGKVLDVDGGNEGKQNGTKVQQWDWTGVNDNQKWKIESLGDGYYKLTAKHSGKVLDVDGGNGATQNEAKVQQWDWTGVNDNQKWKITAVNVGDSVNVGDYSQTYLLMTSVIMPVKGDENKNKKLGFMGMAEFNGNLYIAKKEIGDDSHGMWCFFYDGTKCGTESKIPGGTQTGPFLVVFQNRLYAIWRGVDNDAGLYYSSSSDGISWTNFLKIPELGSDYTPYALVYNNRLWVFWKGVNSDGGIYYASSADGNKWTAQVKIEGAGTSAPPTVAVLSEQRNPQLPPTMASPAMMLVWKGYEGDQGIWYTILNCAPATPTLLTANPQKQIPNVGTWKNPTIFVQDGRPYLLWRGVKTVDKEAIKKTILEIAIRIIGSKTAKYGKWVGPIDTAFAIADRVRESQNSMELDNDSLIRKWDHAEHDCHLYWSTYINEQWIPQQIVLGGFAYQHLYATYYKGGVYFAFSMINNPTKNSSGFPTTPSSSIISQIIPIVK